MRQDRFERSLPLMRDAAEDFLVSLAKLARDKKYSDDEIEKKAVKLVDLIFLDKDKAMEDIDAMQDAAS